MTHYLIAIFLLFSNIITAQGLILKKSIILKDWPQHSKVDKITTTPGNSRACVIVNTNDSLFYLLDNKIHGIRPESLDLEKENEDYYFDDTGLLRYDSIIAYVNNNRLFFHDLKRKSKTKELVLAQDYEFTPMYFYQDLENLYTISFYNNNNLTKLGHDKIHLIKISKKDRSILLKKHIDIGKEVILAPLSFQSVAFNTKEFLIASSIKNELYRLDLNFEIIDTIILDPNIKTENWNKFNSTFPDDQIENYLYKAKNVFYNFDKGGLFDQRNIFKIIFVDNTTLLICFMNGKFDQFEMEYYSLAQNRTIAKLDFDQIEKDYKPITLTRRVYNDYLDNTLTLIDTKIEGEKVFYQIKYYYFSPEERIDKNLIQELLKIEDRNLSSAAYSGVMLVNEFYCWKCQKEIGEGVLILMEISDDTPKAIKNSLKEKLKMDLNSKGELLLLPSSELKKISEKLKPNTVHPIGP